jgi:hypothetical protein
VLGNADAKKRSVVLLFRQQRSTAALALLLHLVDGSIEVLLPFPQPRNFLGRRSLSQLVLRILQQTLCHVTTELQ